MQDRKLLQDLLSAESEESALATLATRGVLNDPTRWRALGNLRNNQSVVQAQQSTATAALVEKFTNGLDAILLRGCKARRHDPRGPHAPQSMAAAVQDYFGDLSANSREQIRELAENNLILYATGSKARPCLSLYDAGEGQLPEHFPTTFCSLISGSDEGSYKGAIPFVQGRFNMGGTGVLPFCGDARKLQLIVSRVPADVVAGPHEWGFTIFCFFPSKQTPEWRYLVGPDGKVLTAGFDPLALVPKLGAKAGEVCAPRERFVSGGTLVKMYDYKAPRSNICGELFKKLDEYLLRPALPLRIIECRAEYKANVMGVTVWNRLAAWPKERFEEGFQEGASITVSMANGEIVPGEIRVFKAIAGTSTDQDQPLTGVRALINGQCHGRRDAQFFRNKGVDKEHIAGSMLVTLDCTGLGQDSRNALFMSNRETFREDPLLLSLLKSLQRELLHHEGLKALNQKRYEEKIANATSDDDGIAALEELLSTDPALAELFGSMVAGKVAADTVQGAGGQKITEEIDPPKPFEGTEFPSYFKRADGATSVHVQMPRGSSTRVSFLTDVKNNYFTRPKGRGTCTIQGAMKPTFHLFNGRLTFTFTVPANAVEATTFVIQIEIADSAGHGPFKLVINGTVAAPREKREREPRPEPPPKARDAPSRPDIVEVVRGPEEPPITIEQNPTTKRIQLFVNTGSRLLSEAKALRPQEEAAAVEFVFKYGLALAAMGLLDSYKKTPEWEENEAGCRTKIQDGAAGVARVIVPLCLSLPKKLPKAA